MMDVRAEFRKARDGVAGFLAAYWTAEGTADATDAELGIKHLSAMLRTARKNKLPVMGPAAEDDPPPVAPDATGTTP